MIDDVGVVGGRLVVHAPAAVDKLETAAGHQSFDDLPRFPRLLLPPLGEKGHFDVDEPAPKAENNFLSLFSGGGFFFCVVNSSSWAADGNKLNNLRLGSA